MVCCTIFNMGTNAYLALDHSQLNSLYTHVEIFNSIINITNPNTLDDRFILVHF